MATTPTMTPAENTLAALIAGAVCSRLEDETGERPSGEAREIALTVIEQARAIGLVVTAQANGLWEVG